MEKDKKLGHSGRNARTRTRKLNFPNKTDRNHLLVKKRPQLSCDRSRSRSPFIDAHLSSFIDAKATHCKFYQITNPTDGYTIQCIHTQEEIHITCIQL